MPLEKLSSTQHAVVVEVGPRDGLQAESIVLPVAVRAEMIRRLAGAGLARIEAVSFVHPDRVPQMADAEAVLAAVRSAETIRGTHLIGLVLNRRGLERAREVGVDEVNLVVATTDAFSLANQGRRVDELVAECGELVAEATEAGLPVSVTVSTSFGCPYTGEVPLGQLVGVVEQLVAIAVPDKLALADSIGVAVPCDVVERLAEVSAVIDTERVALRCHFHDTRDTAIANVAAAFCVGIRTFDASVGGLGGCPFAPGATGNLATEDLLYLLGRSGVETGVTLDAVRSLTPWLEEQLGHSLPGAMVRSGGFPLGQ
ncbi:MAG: hydroxymethylglutaryl-CoA lyase [Actinomycetota bacterium]